MPEHLFFLTWIVQHCIGTYDYVVFIKDKSEWRANMVCRRKLTSVLHNFLGTYTSRYSEYNGYWLFGMLIGQTESLDFDLLHAEDNNAETPLVANAKRLAVEKFADQVGKAGLPISYLRKAWLHIFWLPDVIQGVVNGQVCAGHDVRFMATAVSDVGKTYEWTTSVFVSPHNSLVEHQSTRAM